jgi:hypothetical protein
MALIYDRNVPAGLVNVAEHSLGELAGVPDVRGGRSPLSRVVVSHTPLPVYSLRLDTLARPDGPWDAGLTEAKPESWRMFVVDVHEEPTGVADVAPPITATGEPRFLGYTQGPRVASFGQILTDADETEPLSRRDFQPGFLDVPGINVLAVWLKALDDQADVVIPAAPVPRFLSAQPNYSLGEFINLARVRAVDRLKFDNAPQGDMPRPQAHA